MTDSDSTTVFICGSALRGQPDHGNLSAAEFLGAAQTQARYRMHSIKNGWHPGIYEVKQDESGIAIPGELYRLSKTQYENLLASEPPAMYPATVLLENGDTAIAMLYPRELIEQTNEPDISHYGGWAAYKAAEG